MKHKNRKAVIQGFDLKFLFFPADKIRFLFMENTCKTKLELILLF